MQQNNDTICRNKFWVPGSRPKISKGTRAQKYPKSTALLFTRPVPMIHRVTQSLDFGRNITAFIFWPLFFRQLSPSGWNLIRHVDKDIINNYTLITKRTVPHIKFPGRDGSYTGDYATRGSCHLAHAARATHASRLLQRYDRWVSRTN